MPRAASQELRKLLALRRLQQGVAALALGQAHAQLALAELAQTKVEAALSEDQQSWQASFTAQGIDLNRARLWSQLIAERAADLERAVLDTQGAEEARDGARSDLGGAILRTEAF